MPKMEFSDNLGGINAVKEMMPHIATPEELAATYKALHDSLKNDKALLAEATEFNNDQSSDREYSQTDAFFVENGQLFGVNDGKRIFLGNFGIKILGEIERRTEICDEANDVTGVSRELFWDVLIVVNGSSYRGDVTQSDYRKLEWIERLSKGRAYHEETSLSKRLLKKYLQLLILQGGFPEEIIYASPGWKDVDGKGEQFFYVTREGIVGHPEMPVRAAKGFEILGNATCAMSPAESIQSFLDMRNIISENKKTQ